MRVGVLEGPAARPDVGTPSGPVALHVEDLERLEPVERRLYRRRPRVPARLHQRMSGERGVPDRRKAGLAVGLIVLDHEEALDRLTRRDEMRMIGRVAQRIEHQDGIRHGGIDPAETVLAVEALGHESRGGVNGAAAQRRRKVRLGALEQPVDRAEDFHPCPRLMRARRPLAHGLRRRGEQFRDRDAARIGGARLQSLQHEKGHEHRARPIGDLVEMEGEPARQQHDLDRHGRNAAPRYRAVQRQQEAREDVALRRAAMGEDGFARAAHVRRLGIVADHLERKIGLDAGADIERARVEDRPSAVIALDSPEINGDQALELEIGLFAAKMPEQHILRRDRRVGLELETPMAVLALTSEQRLRRSGNMTLQRLRREVLGMVQSDVHGEALTARGFGATAPELDDD